MKWFTRKSLNVYTLSRIWEHRLQSWLKGWISVHFQVQIRFLNKQNLNLLVLDSWPIFNSSDLKEKKVFLGKTWTVLEIIWQLIPLLGQVFYHTCACWIFSSFFSFRFELHVLTTTCVFYPLIPSSAKGIIPPVTVFIVFCNSHFQKEREMKKQVTSLAFYSPYPFHILILSPDKSFISHTSLPHFYSKGFTLDLCTKRKAFWEHLTYFRNTYIAACCNA